MRRLVLSILLSLAATVAPAQSADHPFAPFVVVDEEDGILALVGDIDGRLPLMFERAVAAMGRPSFLLLDSDGGSVHAALAVASRVRELGIATGILTDHGCYSACAYIFLAGTVRVAGGELGVHQMSAGDGEADFVSGQFAIADMLDVLREFDTPPELVSKMLRTPPEDIYILTQEEKVRFGLFGGAADTARDAPVAVAPPPTRPSLTDPSTWPGHTINGALLEDGRRWFSWLYPDGRTLFQTTKGDRLRGRYEIRAGAVCYLYDGETEWVCRWPVRRGGTIRWQDERGVAISRIVAVNDVRPAAVDVQADVRDDVVRHIPAGECVLVVASRRTVPEARAWVRANVADRRFVKGFRASNGWIAISVGTLDEVERDPVIARWKASGRIPRDSFCTEGTTFTAYVDLGF
ncbi:MAG: hypothetical protein ACU0CO_11815 [Shimia sp.]